jgi:hypothetical protein
MPHLRPLALLLLLFCLHPGIAASAEDNHQPAPLGWVYLRDGMHELTSRPGKHKEKSDHLTQGALAPVLKITERGGVKWAQIRILNLGTASSQTGWLEEAGPADILPAENYPPDADLLRQLGAPYLDDFTAEHTKVARFLVRQDPRPPLLLCYVFADPLPTAKLVVFTPSQGKYLPGASLDFPISELKAGIISLEVRDLVGDGNEYLVSREPFRVGPETRGVNVVIRRITESTFLTVWQAPVEFRNLSEFKSKMQILQPPERNIGTPGTVTTGQVTFHPRGNGQEPIWKGKVEFFALGREAAVDSVSIEKACAWDGKEFAPLQ